ncbi:MAG: T9SS type A sorting domain-containing protein [Owenweeksia sp.]|nr:T9SS type A sorting domain-containing protein [Owenweeksia sp.]
MVNTTSSSTTLSGLSPNTDYDFYVRDSCGMGMVSNWVGPYTFTTLCTPFTAPYSENFDNAVVQPEIPGCWTNLVQSTTIVSFANTFGTGSNYVSAPNAIVFYNAPSSSSSDFISIISPEFSDLTSNVNRVRFQAQTADGSSLLVGTMSDRTDSSTFVLAGVVPGGLTSYNQVTVDLTNVPAGHKYVAFVHSLDNGQDYIYMDNVNYEVIPCNQSAGTGSFTTVCGSNSAVNLASKLSGADTGGVFIDTDNTGALTDSIFDATAVAPNNSYSFTYVLSQSGCTNDSALITINIEEPTNAGMDAQDTICHSNTVDLSNYLGSNAQAGGNWIDVSGSGALNGSVFDVSQVASNADYSFAYVVSGATCENDTADIEINVPTQAVAGSDTTGSICDTVTVDLNSYLSANAQANGNWLDTDGTGALSGSNFDARQVTTNSNYLFEYWVSTAQCDDTSQVVIQVQDCGIGMREFESAPITVYPNPSSGRVNMEQTQGGSPITRIVVISLSGQEVYQKTVNGIEKAELDLSNYARGVYQLKVVTQEGVHFQRILKK